MKHPGWTGLITLWCAAGTAIAHPGHGWMEPLKHPTHFVLEPVDAATFMMAAIFILLAAWRFVVYVAMVRSRSRQ